MAKTQYICMSNAIILDRRLKPSAVRVMSALLRFRRSNGTVSVTLERLAATANCSVHTVQSADRRSELSPGGPGCPADHEHLSHYGSGHDQGLHPDSCETLRCTHYPCRLSGWLLSL